METANGGNGGGGSRHKADRRDDTSVVDGRTNSAAADRASADPVAADPVAADPASGDSGRQDKRTEDEAPDQFKVHRVRRACLRGYVSLHLVGTAAMFVATACLSMLFLANPYSFWARMLTTGMGIVFVLQFQLPMLAIWMALSSHRWIVRISVTAAALVSLHFAVVAAPQPWAILVADFWRDQFRSIALWKVSMMVVVLPFGTSAALCLRDAWRGERLELIEGRSPISSPRQWKVSDLVYWTLVAALFMASCRIPRITSGFPAYDFPGNRSLGTFAVVTSEIYLSTSVFEAMLLPLLTVVAARAILPPGSATIGVRLAPIWVGTFATCAAMTDAVVRNGASPEYASVPILSIAVVSVIITAHTLILRAIGVRLVAKESPSRN